MKKKLMCVVLSAVLSVQMIMAVVFASEDGKAYRPDDEISGNISVSDNSETEIEAEAVSENGIHDIDNEVTGGQDEDLTGVLGWKEGDISAYLFQTGGFPSADLYNGIECADEPFEKPSEKDPFCVYVKEAFDAWDGDPCIEINVSGFGLKEDEVRSRLAILVNENPEYYFWSGKYRYQESDTVSVIQIIIAETMDDTVSTIMSKSGPANPDDLFVSKVSSILKQVNEEWSEEEKALWVHEWIVDNIKYDFEARADYYNNPKAYSAYGAIVDGLAVCQGYALAYDYLLEMLGLRCGLVNSDELNHAWNLIQVDNKLYFVDATWDDLDYLPGMSRHNNFMRSRQGMIETGHSSSDWMNYNYPIYEKDGSSSDRDDYFWTGCKYRIWGTGRKWVYHKDNTDNVVYAYDYVKKESIAVVQYNDRWPRYGGGFYSRWYAAVGVLGSYFVISGPDYIYLLDVDSKQLKELYTLSDAEKANGYIYYLEVNDGVVTYYLCKEESELYSGNYTTGTVDWRNYNKQNVRKRYTVHSSAGKGGSITPNDFTMVYEGDDITFNVTPLPGYSVAAYVLNGNRTESDALSYTLKNIDTDMSLSVEFREKTESSEDPVTTPGTEPTRLKTLATRQKTNISSYFGYGTSRYVVSPKGMASVSAKGLLTAKKPGTATITGMRKVRKNVWIQTGVCKIEIETPKITKPPMLTCINDSINIRDYITNTSLVPDRYIFGSKKAVSVDSDGQIKVLKSGSSIITVCFGTGKNAAKYQTTIKVKLPVLNKKKVRIRVGKTTKLKLKKTDKVAERWYSSDDRVALVADGYVTGINRGSAVITAVLDGVEYKCDVTVR